MIRTPTQPMSTTTNAHHAELSILMSMLPSARCPRRRRGRRCTPRPPASGRTPLRRGARAFFGIEPHNTRSIELHVGLSRTTSLHRSWCTNLHHSVSLCTLCMPSLCADTAPHAYLFVGEECCLLQYCSFPFRTRARLQAGPRPRASLCYS